MFRKLCKDVALVGGGRRDAQLFSIELFRAHKRGLRRCRNEESKSRTCASPHKYVGGRKLRKAICLDDVLIASSIQWQQPHMAHSYH